MTKELFWLTLTVALTGLMWVPYTLDRMMVRGLMGSMANPSRTDKPQSAWAQRLYFAHTNAVENLVVCASLVLILDAEGRSTPATATTIDGRGLQNKRNLRARSKCSDRVSRQIRLFSESLSNVEHVRRKTQFGESLRV